MLVEKREFETGNRKLEIRERERLEWSLKPETGNRKLELSVEWKKFYWILGIRKAPGIPASVVANWALLA